MKVKKNLYLDHAAVIAGEREAARTGGKSLSELVEKQLLALGGGDDDHFSKHHGKAVQRVGDSRYEYLSSKHRGGRS